ncbi:MAG TPA: GAF domain-containing protein [Ignavibacteriaceae bacterium]|nr:GAF domain-containing protein [Ignavibacteriaceae bacterium]
MAESIIANKSASLEEQYQLLVKQVKSLLDRNDNIISNLSNFTAALKQTFEKISWVGFYLYDGNELYLGPFQGKVACTKIQMGKGVCGTSAMNRETIIVPDVNAFPGHITCDVESRSEIVVPIIKNDKFYGVLDLDSTSLSAFNQTDKKYLEEIVDFLVKEIL